MSQGGILLRCLRPTSCYGGANGVLYGKVAAAAVAVQMHSSRAPPRCLFNTTTSSSHAALPIPTYTLSKKDSSKQRPSPIARAWDNSRSCSSHASSSLVKMATDRDILSDE